MGNAEIESVGGGSEHQVQSQYSIEELPSDKRPGQPLRRSGVRHQSDGAKEKGAMALGHNA